MSNSITYFIYRIVCFQTGKVYIGQTKDPETRKKSHLQALRANRHVNVKLQNAYNKYGESQFYFEVIQQDIPKDEIDNVERKWIVKTNAIKEGFNLSNGGQGGGNIKHADRIVTLSFEEVLEIMKNRGDFD